MRRSDRQITDPDELESILRNGRVCFLSMVDDGKPYVVPVHYGYEEGTLYIHSAPEGRKIDIIRKNPDVCFSIVADFGMIRGKNACSWSTNYTSVIGTGKAIIQEDRREKEKGLDVLMGQYSDEKYDFTGVDLDNVVIIKVEIGEINGKKSRS